MACVKFLKISIMVFCGILIILQVINIVAQIISGGNVILSVLFGVISIIIPGLGFLGAFQESKCMLMTYIVLIILNLFLMILFNVIVLVTKGRLEDMMKMTLSTYGKKPESKMFWDKLQTSLKCCGINSYKDWTQNIPDSCCRQESPGKLYDCNSVQTAEALFMDGCYTKMMSIMNISTGYLFIVIALILVSQIVFACLLYGRID